VVGRRGHHQRAGGAVRISGLGLALLLCACGAGSRASHDDGGTTDDDAGTLPDGAPALDAGPAWPPPTLELRCKDGVDDDGDEAVDCDDSDCDVHLACQPDTCPAGFTRVVLEPVPVPDAIPVQDNLYVYFPGPNPSQAMTRVEWQLTLRHEQAGTLQIEYYAPAGAANLPLTYGVGQPGADFDRTIVTDDSTVDFLDDTPPYRGRYHPPDYPLHLLHDYAISPEGTWTLHIANPTDAPGILDALAVAMCVCDDCEVGPTCTNGLDDDADGSADCATDTCTVDRRCIPETQCGDDEESFANPIGFQVDQDLDDLIDCRDPDCDGIDGCEFAHELTCDDGLDNDNDGFDHFSDGPKDCRDPDCTGSQACRVEASCTNGADDDGHGKVDCADVGCQATVACGGTEAMCTGGVDDDRDGQVDCADADCAGRLGCIAVTCPAGDTLVVVESQRTPTIYGLENWELIQLYQPTAGKITKVLAELSAGPDNVYVSLESPGLFPAFAGPLLSYYEGPYDHVIFDDSAPDAVATSGPYTGRWRSAGDPLSQLHGLQARGVWNLQVSQVGAGEPFGALATHFAIAVCVCTTCELPEVCNDFYDNDGDGARDCDDSDCASRPICQ
jgi:hypothetical protein